MNGHVEEMYTGHTIVKAFGHEEKSLRKFEEVNERLYESGWRAQFISGMIMPIMGFIGNIGYVLVSVAGGILVLRKSITIGDVQAFIHIPASSRCRSPDGANRQHYSVDDRLGERVFELLDEQEEVVEAEDAVVITPDKDLSKRRLDKDTVVASGSAALTAGKVIPTPKGRVVSSM